MICKGQGTSELHLAGFSNIKIFLSEARYVGAGKLVYSQLELFHSQKCAINIEHKKFRGAVMVRVEGAHNIVYVRFSPSFQVFFRDRQPANHKYFWRPPTGLTLINRLGSNLANFP